MKRERNSTRIFPVGVAPREGYPTVASSENDQLFAKVVTATPGEVLRKIVLPEEEVLNIQMKEDGNEPEACFIQEALALVAARKTELEKGAVASEEARCEVAVEPHAGEVSVREEQQASCVVSPEVRGNVVGSLQDDGFVEG
jgi:hypothetical protein